MKCYYNSNTRQIKIISDSFVKAEESEFIDNKTGKELYLVKECQNPELVGAYLTEDQIFEERHFWLYELPQLPKIKKMLSYIDMID